MSLLQYTRTTREFPCGFGNTNKTIPPDPLATPDGYGEAWAGEVYPYTKNTKVYDCPDDLSA